MKIAVLLCLAVAMVSAIDLRMCLRNCRMNDHYCKYMGSPGQMGNFCMQKNNECQVGCIVCMDICKQQAQKCNQKCDDAFYRLFLQNPMMEYVYPEMEAEDWTVKKQVSLYSQCMKSSYATELAIG
ncbi:hypothetical protein EB796_024923 [Bugula neritina]|uniref:Uncharacterized protein n=1 Tax=Bugula neritina TaxID=10212 RepID=A0A7J7ISA4_BUGNE|nr:hypothetical protein EB796_024923 [Bugula neritina]